MAALIALSALPDNSLTMLRSLEFPVIHDGGQALRAMVYSVRRG